MSENVVFLLDVDNTLLDGDQLVADFKRCVEREIGASCAARYWAIFNDLRNELGFVDYLGALQRYRIEVGIRRDAQSLDSQPIARMASFLIDYPFAERLYDRAFEVIRHLGDFGNTVVLTDGDVVLQPRKIQRSGLWDAVGGRVLIYIHKENMLDAVEQYYPATHYVMIDDKPGILSAVKAKWQSRVTTILPLQGHYALDAMRLSNFSEPDVIINDIGKLASTDLAALFEKTAVAIQHKA